MVGKIVRFDDATWSLINLLRRERRRSFQQLSDEAFRDLIKLKDQLRDSLDEEAPRPKRRRKSDDNA